MKLKEGEYYIIDNKRVNKKLCFETICSSCGNKLIKISYYTKNSKHYFCNPRCCYDFKIKFNLYPRTGKHYVVSEETKIKISKSMKGTKNSVGRIHSLETRLKMSKAKRGEKSPLWLGGNENIQGYTPIFSKQIRERVRVRDNFHCQLCKIPELELNKRLDIHHIDFDKKNCNMDNLISLCRSCHGKVRFRKENYIQLFKEVIFL